MNTPYTTRIPVRHITVTAHARLALHAHVMQQPYAAATELTLDVLDVTRPAPIISETLSGACNTSCTHDRARHHVAHHARTHTNAVGERGCMADDTSGARMRTTGVRLGVRLHGVAASAERGGTDSRDRQEHRTGEQENGSQ